MIKSILSIAFAFLLSTQIFGQEAVNTIKLNYSQEEFKKAKESLSFTFEVSNEELGKKMVENTEKFYTQFFTLKQENRSLKITFLKVEYVNIFYRLMAGLNVSEVLLGDEKMKSEIFLSNHLSK